MLLQLARQYQLWFKCCQDQPNGSYQRMFLFSSASVWFTPNRRRVENRKIPGALGNEARRLAGNRSEAVQAADDRFKTRFSNQSESFTESTECADGQRRGVCRRHNLFGCARRLLLSGLPSGQVHAANRRVAGIRADDGAARHRRVCFRAAARLDWQVRDYSHRPRQPVCFGRLPAASLHWRFPAIDVQARQLL